MNDLKSMVERLKELHEKATEGPWRYCSASENKCKCRCISSACGEYMVAVAHGEHYKETLGDPWPTDEIADANKELICEMRNALPLILKLVSAVKELLEVDSELCGYKNFEEYYEVSRNYSDLGNRCQLSYRDLWRAYNAVLEVSQ